MGRSRNTALVLVSQNAGDLLNEQVTNCLSAVFAFRSTERSEVASVLSLLGVDPSDEHQAVLRGLGNGECIFRDLDGRAGRIVVDLISDDLRRFLDTNPTRAASSQVPVSGTDEAGEQGGEQGGTGPRGQRAAGKPAKRDQPAAPQTSHAGQQNGQHAARGRPPTPAQAPAP
jgi:hypothetical protein